MKSNADRFHDSLPTSQRAEYRRFEREILDHHLKRRNSKDPHSPFVVDRRNELLGWGPRKVLREPPTNDRPRGGPSTTNRKQAEFWVEQYYAPLYWKQVRESAHAVSDIQLTVAEASTRYISSLEVTHSHTGKRVIPRKHRARASKLRRHIIPTLGPMILATVTPDHVSTALDAMVVTDRADRRKVIRPAMHSTRRETLKALAAVWRHTFRNSPVPFNEANLKKSTVVAEDRLIDANDLAAVDDDLKKMMKGGVMSSDQVRQSLVGATRFDMRTTTLPHLAHYIPNSAHLIALLIGLGVRVSELVQLRWQHFNLDKLFVTVPQSKIIIDENGKPNKDPYRIVPIQKSLLPWIRSLMALYGIQTTKGCKTFVVQLTWPNVMSECRASEDSVIGRVSMALQFAGTKPVGKATHFGRATHISIAAMAPGLEPHMIKAFVGHKAFSNSETDGYFRLHPGLLRPVHHRYLHLPSPDVVRRAAKHFKKSDAES